MNPISVKMNPMRKVALSSLILFGMVSLLSNAQTADPTASISDPDQAVRKTDVLSLIGPRVTTAPGRAVVPLELPGYQLRVLTSTKEVVVNLNQDGRFGKDTFLKFELPIYIYVPKGGLYAGATAGTASFLTGDLSMGDPGVDAAKVKRQQLVDALEKQLVAIAARTPGNNQDFDQAMQLVKQLREAQ
jgi:hypothetical protein